MVQSEQERIEIPASQKNIPQSIKEIVRYFKSKISHFEENSCFWNRIATFCQMIGRKYKGSIIYGDDQEERHNTSRNSKYNMKSD